ncbi:MAG TPA: transposase, partial [Thermoanaerobaculaceae bacterium]|nr:transposase [Thermoanaerobaculaceae bacterium]
AEYGPLREQEQRLVKMLELIRIEAFITRVGGRWPGRPEKDRRPLARAFVAKAVYGFPTTRAALEALATTANLRHLCGWERRGEVPSEASFSRAFAALAASELPQRVHAALINTYQQPRLVGHVSRDATAIEAHEKAAPRVRAETTVPEAPRRRGRPRKGEQRLPKPMTRLQRQAAGLELTAVLAELPQVCDFGCKRNSDGKTAHWRGYKLHIDWADGEIPVSCLLTSASVHDSQVAIPLATTSASRVTNLYDVMDSAYDVKEIREHSVKLGHRPIIEPNSRRHLIRPEMEPAQARRYHERTTAERGNARLKDQFGARTVRVRGAVKVMAHLMFGILALTADQLLRLTGWQLALRRQPKCLHRPWPGYARPMLPQPHFHHTSLDAVRLSAPQLSRSGPHRCFARGSANQLMSKSAKTDSLLSCRIADSLTCWRGGRDGLASMLLCYTAPVRLECMDARGPARRPHGGGNHR